MGYRIYFAGMPTDNAHEYFRHFGIRILDSNPDSPLNKLPPLLRQDLDKYLCTCNDVPKIEIINAIVKGATTVEAVRKETYATMGVGCCTQQVERLIELLCAPEPAKRRRKNKEGS